MPQQSPLSGTRVVLLVAGLVVLMLGLFAGAGLLLPDARPTAQGTQPARTTEPTQTPEGQATAEPTPTEPGASEVTPSRNPRRAPDVDRGKPLKHGMYVEVPPGWSEVRSDLLGLRLESSEGASAAFYWTKNPLPSMPLLRPDAQAFAELQELHGVRVGAAESLPPPNLNIVEAGRVTFTGRRSMDDVTYSLAGECVRLRGRSTVNDVSVSICFAAYVQDLEVVRAEVRQMIASVARSI